jgi:hypothetical protein
MAAVGFLVRISRKPNKANKIASKKTAFANGKDTPFRAIDMVVKP